MKNNSVLVLESSEVKTLELDKEYLKEFPDDKILSIHPIKGSENKVFISISYLTVGETNQKVDNSPLKKYNMDFSIGEIDYKDFTVKNLKSFKRSTPYDYTNN